jgi:hypothetical protein
MSFLSGLLQNGYGGRPGGFGGGMSSPFMGGGGGMHPFLQAILGSQGGMGNFGGMANSLMSILGPQMMGMGGAPFGAPAPATSAPAANPAPGPGVANFQQHWNQLPAPGAAAPSGVENFQKQWNTLPTPPANVGNTGMPLAKLQGLYPGMFSR